MPPEYNKEDEMRTFTKRFVAIVFGIWLLMIAPATAQKKADDSAAWKKMDSDAELEQELRWIRAEAEAEIVTATKRKIPVRKAPAIATVITAEEIRSMGARDLMDVLKTVPCFGVSTNVSGGYMFEVRGLRTAQNEKILLMIDGHRMNDSYYGGCLDKFSMLSVQNIKQIEVIRGPGSALYGANAFVAAINIITKDAQDTDGVEVTAAGGSFDTKKFSLVGGKSFEKFEIAGSVYHADSDGPRLTIDADQFAGKPYSKTPGKTDSYLQQTEVFLKASYGNLEFTGQYFDKERGAYIGFGNALTDGSVYPQKNFWAELAYSHSFTNKASVNFRIYYDLFEETDDSRIMLFPEGYPEFPDGMFGCPSFKNRTVGTEIQYDLDLFKGNHLIAGFDYEYIEQYDVRRSTNFDPWTNAPLGSLQDISSWGNYNKDVTRKVWAAYFQDEWEIADGVNFTAGVRHDHYDDFGGTTNPRLGLVWSFLKDADLKLLYGQAFRSPSFRELYNSNLSAIGDPNLQPEEIRTYEAALGYRLKTSHGISLTYFHNDIENLITTDTGPPAHYLNMGGAKVDGIEVGLSGKYSADNYWKLNYTWQNPKDADTDEDLPDVPTHRASLSVNYGFTKYLSAHTDILWTGERPRVSGDDRGDMPSYTTVDLTLIAKNFYKNLEVRGIIHNLFDTEYEDPDMSGAQKLIPYDYPREGISALLEFSYRF
jgi:outer membrane cobalamin receptor